MTPRARLLGALLASCIAVGIGVLAAWPIYETLWLLVPAGAGLALGAGVAVWGARRLSPLLTAVALACAFAVTVVPVAVPQAFTRMPEGLIRGLGDGLSAIVLGWKQLLTLTLPVGTYQSVLVPAYLVFLLTAFTVTSLTVRTPRAAPFAAIPAILPVLFGTVFGSSVVSAPIRVLGITILAPRELGLWTAAALAGALWVWFSAGAERRAALRRGKQPGVRTRGTGRVTRVALGGGTLVVALAAGMLLAPVLDAGARQVPRDRVDPEIVLRERPSPLSAYRSWKRDETLDLTMFEVTSDGALPERLRLAVLDAYDGVDFHVSADAAGRFTRLPSTPGLSSTAAVSVRIGDGYSDIWVPLAALGSVPTFSGGRAGELADSFYLNPATGAGIAVPGGEDTQGLAPGDGFRASMTTAPSQPLDAPPKRSASTIDLDAHPELAAWLKAQDQPATAEGLTELITRLRDRGYVSHSLSDRPGEQLWLERLSEQYGTKFETSASGHSRARLEQLFAQLNAQERVAGAEAPPEMLVAGIGDDEQFAPAAALIARALGYDSRVVLGVRLGEESGGVPGIPACDTACTGEHLAVWTEVRGAQGGWATIDASPQVELHPTRLEEGEQLPEFPTTPEERDAHEVDPPLGLGERSDDGEQPQEEQAGHWIWPVLRTTGLSLGALVFLLIPLLFLPLAKRRRERIRRSRTDPEASTLGAWQQMLDSAHDSGVVIPPHASRRETAELLGTQPARWTALTADRAVFSPAGVSETDAEWAWAAVEADRAEREARLTRWQRLRARYSLRSYGVRIGRSRDGAQESAAGTASETSHEGAQ